MTRGTFYYIESEKYVYESTEFNGDMYPEGHGDLALKMLDEVKDVTGFVEMLVKFNSENHNYRDTILVFVKKDFFDENHYVDFSKDYYDRFFSDWLFIKNASTNQIKFTDKNGKKGVIKAGETIRLNFGCIVKELVK